MTTRPSPRELCLYRDEHTSGSSTTPWVLGGANEVTEVITTRRQIVVKRLCQNCGTRSGAIPKQAVLEWMAELGNPLPRTGDLSPYPPCSYRGCSGGGEDMHHFAPRNTFKDADDWPVLPLCRTHHVEWHTRMDGYRWHKKGAA